FPPTDGNRLLTFHYRPNSILDPRVRSVSKPAGTDTMKTLFDILKKDRKGTFHWVEAVNDIDTAEARLRQLSSESSDEFVVCRHFLSAPCILQVSEHNPKAIK